MRPEQPRGTTEAPQFQIGQQVEATINDIEQVTGEYGKQLQLSLTLIPSGYSARAWVKYYPTPAPHQHLGKLCLAIERVTGQSFSSLDTAIAALKSYGRIYVRAKASKTVTGDDGTERTFPRFSVAPDTLPGEQPQQAVQPPQAPVQPPTGLKPLVDLNKPQAPQPQPAPKDNLTANTLTTETYQWLLVSQSDIGQVLDGPTWNNMRNLGIAQELAKYGLVSFVDGQPVLSEKCREYL